MTRAAIIQNKENRRSAASKKPEQQANRSILDNSSSGFAGNMTPPEDWTEVSSPGSLPLEISVNADRNIGYCEGLFVGFLDSLHVMQPEIMSLHSKDSPGRVLLRDACKLLMKERTTYTDTVNEIHSKDDETSDSEEDHKAQQALEFVIETMSPEITDRDIARLVLCWTTLDEFKDFKRVEVSKNHSKSILCRLLTFSTFQQL